MLFAESGVYKISSRLPDDETCNIYGPGHHSARLHMPTRYLLSYINKIQYYKFSHSFEILYLNDTFESKVNVKL